MTLEEFLEQALRAPFAGEQDCGRMVADWVVETGHPDPAARWRGRYSTDLGRARLVKREGGLLAMMSLGLTESGLSETETANRGDVALIERWGGEFAAICLGELWAIKSTRGLTGTRADAVVKAWSVPHG